MPTTLTVRFPSDVLEAIRHEAQANGDSAAEFIRTAALVRAALNYTRRNGPGNPLLDELYDAAARVVAQHDTQR